MRCAINGVNLLACRKELSTEGLIKDRELAMCIGKTGMGKVRVMSMCMHACVHFWLLVSCIHREARARGRP